MVIYSQNKKALFDYEILERHEAGLVLFGQEVKSIRSGRANLKSAFVTFHGNNAYLTNAHIPKYEFAGNVKNYDPKQSRQLLLRKKEIGYLRGKAEERGLTIIPLSLYTKGRYIKLEIAVARGKKRYDKREAIKKREINREINKVLKRKLKAH